MILYVTFDGLLQPLGRSQVLRYVEGLSDRGWRFAVLSLERETDLADAGAVAALQARLAARGIEWLWRPYRQGGAGDVVRNIADATLVALDFAAENPLRLVHARSYHAASVALAVKTSLGIPYVFDMRGYWIDERIEDGRWFTTPRTIAAGRAVERQLFGAAEGVVSLATPAAQDIIAGRFGPWDRPIAVIPTCVDEDEFTFSEPPPDFAPELRQKVVLGYIGSLNSSYKYKEAFTLAKHTLSARADAHLLCLTSQAAEIRAHLDALGVPREQTTVATAAHADMPAWLGVVDWGLLLLNTTFAKRGSMPTKLGEYFATGVRPVAHGCNDDVVDWVRRAGSGLVLDSTAPTALRAAAEHIANLGKRPPPSRDEIGRAARDVTMRHFSAASGVERYDSLYRAVLAS